MSLKTPILFSIILLSTITAISAQQARIACYYENRAPYRRGAGAFTPKQIDPILCSHYHYGYFGITPEGEVQILDPTAEIEQNGLTDFSSLKNVAGAQVLITVGGYNQGGAIFSGVAGSQELRANFVESVLNFLQRWNFDGVDIDWAYPAEADQENFVSLLRELRTGLDQRGYVLSVTVAQFPYAGYSVPEISEIADYVNLIAQDYYTPTGSDLRTGHNAPLYGPSGDTTGLNIDNSVTSWIQAGLSPDKINLGVATYGHSYSLFDSGVNGIGAAAYLGISGPYTTSPGFLAYYEICDPYYDYERIFDEEAQVPYKYYEYNWISYDDDASVEAKVKYALSKNLGGVAVWSLDTDDFNGRCGYEFGLLQTVNEFLYGLKKAPRGALKHRHN